MSAPPDIRSQLRSLSIAREQRPAVAQEKPAPAQHRRRVRWGLAMVLVAAIVGSTAWVMRNLPVTSSAAADQPSIRLFTVRLRREGETAPVLTATGKIVSDHRVQVSTKVSGQIVELRFEQGDRVERGQVLAKIEDVLYRARRDEAQARLVQAQAKLAYEETNFERVKRLHEMANAPDIEMAEARRAHSEARAEVAAATAALESAQKLLTDCEVLAPIAGVILERNVEVGDFVAAEGGRGAMANSQLGSIADMTSLRVEVDISEADINRLRKGMPCTITPDAYKDRRYQGHLMWIDPGANYSKATVQVKVRIDNPDDRLRVEGSAQVAFAEGSANPPPTDKPALWIPASACQAAADAEQGTVFLAVDGKLRATTVRLGRRSGPQFEVLNGLSEGQSIAADGLDRLRDGQPLTAIP